MRFEIQPIRSRPLFHKRFIKPGRTVPVGTDSNEIVNNKIKGLISTTSLSRISSCIFFSK